MSSRAGHVVMLIVWLVVTCAVTHAVATAFGVLQLDLAGDEHVDSIWVSVAFGLGWGTVVWCGFGRLRYRAPTADPLVRVHRHNVLLDGISTAGKSTLLSRIASPASAVGAEIAATHRHYSVDSVPVCWVQSPGAVDLHSLQLWDVAGERGSTVINAMRELDNAKETATLLIVWDISDDAIGINVRDMLGRGFETTYGSDLALEVVSSIVVFFNKVDTVRPLDLPERVARERRDIQTEVDRVRGVGCPLSFVVGSAATGAGVHDCMGALLRQIGLGDRAEAYYRFPSGPQNLLRYRELRAWVRGAGVGWGATGD